MSNTAIQSRPCPCDRVTGPVWTPDQCFPCHLFHYKPEYRLAWGGRIEAPPVRGPRPPCVWEGEVSHPCPRGIERLHIRHCLNDAAEHGHCMRDGNPHDWVQNCAKCPHYERPAVKPSTIAAYIVTVPTRRESLAATLESLAASDWGVEPTIIEQPESWPVGMGMTSLNYVRAIEKAYADEVPYALVLEDDLHFNQHLRWNLEHWWPVVSGQCDFASLYVPDLLASPWERTEDALNYHIAKPMLRSDNYAWESKRLWGSQAYLFSRKCLRWLLDDWNALGGGQDARVFASMIQRGATLFYHAPCLVQHRADVSSTVGVRYHLAPDYDEQWKAPAHPPTDGMRPAESVPGWFSIDEQRLYYRLCRGKRVLELGCYAGRSTVIAGQAATSVDGIDLFDPGESVHEYHPVGVEEAQGWLDRFGVTHRVRLHPGRFDEVLPTLNGEWDLTLIDGMHGGVRVRADLELVTPRLAAGAIVCCHDYPDPRWPEVRLAVDAWATERGWKRIAQAGYLAAFQRG